jgi:hypothetical protein
MIHFSSVHPLRKTFNNDVSEMRFWKLLRNLKTPSKNDPYCMRPVESVIRTVSGNHWVFCFTGNFGQRQPSLPTLWLIAAVVRFENARTYNPPSIWQGIFSQLLRHSAPKVGGLQPAHKRAVA